MSESRRIYSREPWIWPRISTHVCNLTRTRIQIYGCYLGIYDTAGARTCVWCTDLGKSRNSQQRAPHWSLARRVDGGAPMARASHWTYPPTPLLVFMLTGRLYWLWINRARETAVRIAVRVSMSAHTRMRTRKRAQSTNARKEKTREERRREEKREERRREESIIGG